MAKSDDRDHFKDYRAQTQVKHEILQAYHGPYFRIVGSTNSNLLYIDGFAGPGTYTRSDSGEQFDGSPLRALKLIASDATFSKKVSAFFVEADDALYADLKKAIAEFAEQNPQIKKPGSACCTFADGVRELLARVKGQLAPTFLFVDPCGVAGTCFDTIRTVMASKSSEAFIFFNVDGVRRIAGLPSLSNILIELLGSKERAERLFIALQNEQDVQRREKLILDSYREALRDDMGMEYTIPFRVESEEQQRTSHYFIHATNHRLGFKIMKEVMWNYGHSEHGQGGLEFVQASRSNYIPLFDPSFDVKEQILEALQSGTKCVNLFYNDWVYRPEDLLCQPAYKQALLELETAGRIEVVDKDGQSPKPVASRKKHQGKPTLGEGYYVRIRP